MPQSFGNKIELMDTPPRPRLAVAGSLASAKSAPSPGFGGGARGIAERAGASARASSDHGPRKASSGLELGDTASLMESLQDTAAQDASPQRTWALSWPSSGGGQGAPTDPDATLRTEPHSFDPSQVDGGGARATRDSFPENVGDVSAPHAAAVLLVCGALGLSCAGFISVMCVLFPGNPVTCAVGGHEDGSGTFPHFDCDSFGYFNLKSVNETCNTGLAPCNKTRGNITCCLQNATCEGFQTQELNCSLMTESVLIENPNKMQCLNPAACTQQDKSSCCQFRRTCKSFFNDSKLDCPLGYHNNESASTELCHDQYKCTPDDAATCCALVMNCSAFPCAFLIPPTILRRNATDIKCARQDCTQAECCLNVIDCSLWNETSTCDSGESFFDDARLQKCVNGSAEDDWDDPPACDSTCCNQTSTYCSSCPPGRRLRVGADEMVQSSEYDGDPCCQPDAARGIEL